MKLCTGQCRYLLSIYRLTQERRFVRCVDISNDLHVTRPSVSKMMKCMMRMELIESDYSDSVRLTPYGSELAERMNRDYDMIEMFFSRILRLSPEDAKEHTFLFLSSYPESTSHRLAETMKKSLEASRRRKHAG